MCIVEDTCRYLFCYICSFLVLKVLNDNWLYLSLFLSISSFFYVKIRQRCIDKRCHFLIMSHCSHYCTIQLNQNLIKVITIIDCCCCSFIIIDILGFKDKTSYNFVPNLSISFVQLFTIRWIWYNSIINSNINDMIYCFTFYQAITL